MDDQLPQDLIDLGDVLPRERNAAHDQLLENLQGNILKGHGRHVVTLLLLRFGDPGEARAALGALAGRLTRASEQLRIARKIAEARADGHAGVTVDRTPFVGCVLSAAGYRKLEIAEMDMPADRAFRDGMQSRRESLDDPPASAWEPELQGPIDGMILIAGDPDAEDPTRSTEVEAMTAALTTLLAAGVKVTDTQSSRTWQTPDGRVKEHFGYVDGVSQPLFLQEDVERKGGLRWPTGYPLRSVLVRDFAARAPAAFGSYLVFRKLEQNVATFNRETQSLQEELQRFADRSVPLPPGFAGATLIGRHRDGTPLVTSPTPSAGPDNDFDYGSDPLGLKCPFHAHVRKLNPRSHFPGERKQDRDRVIARRGVTYGHREVVDGEFADAPERGVGLLFMSYQADIAEQFEHIQRQWAGASDFPRRGSGMDPVLGSQRGIVQRAGWNKPVAIRVRRASLDPFVTLRGGEYFFAPSIAFFHRLATESQIPNQSPIRHS